MILDKISHQKYDNHQDHPQHYLGLSILEFFQTLLILQEAEKVGVENILVGEAAKPVFRKLL